MDARELSDLKRVTSASLLALALVSLVWATTTATQHLGGYDFDGRFYAAMAGDSRIPAEFSRTAPWCFRILTPALVSLLPTVPLTGFVIVSYVSNLISLVLMERILGHVGCLPRYRLLGVLLYAGTFWTLKFSFFSPAYIDYQTQLYLLLVVYFTLCRAYGWLPLALLVGALQKESLVAFSLFPLAHLLRHRQTMARGRLALLSITMLALPLLGLLAVRYLVPKASEQSADSLLLPLQLMRQPGYAMVLLQSTFSGLGVLAVVVWLRPRAWSNFLRHEWEWSVFAGLGILALLGGVDKSRLFLYLLPLVVILATKSVANIEDHSSGKKILCWIALLVSMQWYIGGHLTPLTWDTYLAAMVPEHSGGRFFPYLWRNVMLAALLLVASTPLLLGKWLIARGTVSAHTRSEHAVEASGSTQVDRLLASALVVVLVIGPLLLLGKLKLGTSRAERDQASTDLTTPQDSKVRLLIDQSRTLLNQNHPQEALALLEGARELGPNRVDVFINLCVAHGLLREREPAIMACQKAISLDPTSALARNNLAWVSSLPIEEPGKPAKDGAAGAR